MNARPSTRLRGESAGNALGRVKLTAGPLSVVFEAGALRYFKVGELEVLRGVYAAVRDKDWGTVPGVLKDVEINDQGDAFDVRFTSEHVTSEIHFVWRGRVTGDERGRVRFTFDGEAHSTFRGNRVGFCVLHPMRAAGAPCVLEHVDGATTEGRFPEAVSPHQPFKNIRSITHEVTDGLWAEVRMEGDTFEMEDQRNWTDASFKTYCTPLAEPFPVTLQAGTEVKQSVTLELRGLELSLEPYNAVSSTKDDQLTVTFDMNDSSPLPHIGLGAAREPLNKTQVKRLKTLNLSHLRLELELQKDYPSRFKQTSEEAEDLGLELELALHLSDNAEVELQDLRRVWDVLKPPVARVLVFHKNEKSTSERWLEASRRHLPNVPIAGGTDAFFAELNRERPPVGALDLVTYSLNPQVHAFDDASLIETLPAQAVTVASAETFSGGKPVVVSPVTLKLRHNPNATGDKARSLEQQRDPRQTSLFGAAWTLGSLKHLAKSRAHSLTYFEATGPLGVMAAQDEVYPMYHVFADVGEFEGGEVVASRSSRPLLFEGLVLRKGEKQRLMLANFTADEQVIHIAGLKGRHQGRVLGETTAEEARREPERFRARFPLAFEADGDLSVTLNPYTLLTLDGVT